MRADWWVAQGVTIVWTANGRLPLIGTMSRWHKSKTSVFPRVCLLTPGFISLQYALVVHVLRLWCCLQCARATHSRLPTVLLTATAAHSPAVSAMQPATLDMRAHPLPPASPMGLTVP